MARGRAQCSLLACEWQGTEARLNLSPTKLDKNTLPARVLQSLFPASRHARRRPRRNFPSPQGGGGGHSRTAPACGPDSTCPGRKTGPDSTCPGRLVSTCPGRPEHLSGRPGQALRACPGGPDRCSGPGQSLLLWMIQLPAAQDKQSASFNVLEDSAITRKRRQLAAPPRARCSSI